MHYFLNSSDIFYFTCTPNLKINAYFGIFQQFDRKILQNFEHGSSNFFFVGKKKNYFEQMFYTYV